MKSNIFRKGFPDNSVGKEFAYNAGDPGSIPGLGTSPGERKGYPLQYSGPENSMSSPWGHKESDTTKRLSTTIFWKWKKGVYITQEDFFFCLLVFYFFLTFYFVLGYSQLTVLWSFRWTVKWLSHTYTWIHSSPPIQAGTDLFYYFSHTSSHVGS